MKKYRIGYTQGAYDMFHIGHLNLIKHAKEYCDYLIVGVNSDKLIKEYKNKYPVINENERAEIVRNIKDVDECIIANTLDKEVALAKHHYDVIFIGDDWRGNPRWNQTIIDLKKHNVDVIFLPRTEGISSTELTDVIKKILDDNPQGIK